MADGMMTGKVVLVTGAGRGIGREIALLAAREGSAVVVNDLGASLDGAGEDQGPAVETVEAIRAAGGEAVVNGDNVADPAGAERMIATALDAFGRLDAVINNAGILRDRIFHKMSHADFDAVIDVHLRGSFNTSRAAAGLFREQGSGAFVHFTSTSGLIGNIGQANYAAAKMGIVGLSRGISLDMARFGVRSNCVAPFAWSRMIGSIPTETEDQQARVEKLKSLAPAKIAPMVVFLASEDAASITGQIFCVRGNEVFLMSQPRPVRSLHRDGGWTPRALADQMAPAFENDLYGPDVSADVFPWDPI
tara:strand:+ start:8909 stop:9826 length:918 start_codon:yes stop_codon:yes gene_type:complete